MHIESSLGLINAYLLIQKEFINVIRKARENEEIIITLNASFPFTSFLYLLNIAQVTLIIKILL